MENLEKKAEKLYEVLHTLWKKWSLELLAIAKKAPRTYTELQRELGINSKLVSAKLKELVELDVLKKTWDKYDLSKFGKKLFKKIKPLAKAISDFADDVEKKVEKEAKEISKKIKEKEWEIKRAASKISTVQNKKENKKPAEVKKVTTTKTNTTKVTPAKKVVTPEVKKTTTAKVVNTKTTAAKKTTKAVTKK